MKAIFTSDLHGNISQYNTLFKKADKLNISTIIIGGDILVKGLGSSIEVQKQFIKEKLIPLFQKQQSKKHYNILLILGNDDWASCLEELNPFDGKLFDLINMKRKEINGIDFVGYSYVPITPFGIKDWEKWDNENQPIDNVRLQGFKSKGNDRVEFKFNPGNKEDSIENNLKKLSKLSNPKKTVYILHSPPYNTNLDIILGGVHVGSQAIREFIEKEQPLLTLHGHIHESVDVSKKFTEKIGKTISASSGNYNDMPELALIIFDTDNLSNIKREIISCR